ncbi:hypothetical protein DFH28DRAFT_940301 [Melampsora americana]|nr:hypothetical protein DFH28DRAFT_940301 [Melampsora americana]
MCLLRFGSSPLLQLLQPRSNCGTAAAAQYIHVSWLVFASLAGIMTVQFLADGEKLNAQKYDAPAYQHVTILADGENRDTRCNSHTAHVDGGRCCAAAGCAEAFATKGEMDEHRRIAHQAKVTVKGVNGEVHKVFRGHEGTFHCPLGRCVYNTRNPRYLLEHCQTCKGVGPPVVLSEQNQDGAGVVIPAGAEIEVHEVLTKYNLVWNNRCKILICVQCHIGVAVPEVWAHYKRENQPCLYSHNVVKGELFQYLDKVGGDLLPPGYNPGSLCEPVQGLVCYNGYTCTLCNLTWPSKKTLDNHFSLKHNKGV